MRASGDISVLDGGLWQWDLNRSVLVPPDTEEAHFCCVGASNAYVVEPEDGLAPVPNLLLQSGKSIDCWATDSGRTIAHSRLPVQPRAKPSDYVYEATEIATVKSMIADAVANLSYEDLCDLPEIEGTTLVGSLTTEDIGISALGEEEVAEAVEEALTDTEEEE